MLASGSPRRRELLEEAGYRFIVRSPDVEEALNRALTLREIALCNATRKGLAIARTQPGAERLESDATGGDQPDAGDPDAPPIAVHAS